MDERNPLRPKPFIARSREEIIAASRSKYCPVAANTVLKDIVKAKGKFAVVGLPCHVQGVRKAQEIDKNLRDKIEMVLGIFCGMAWNFHATEELLGAVNVSPSDVEAIEYRGRGWPGRMSIRLKNVGLQEFPYPYPYKKLDVDFRALSPSRCLLCTDALSELADISFGDADFSLPDKLGKSVIITRSLAGEQLLQSATTDQVVSLEKIEGKDVVKLRKNLLLRKKKTVSAHFSLYKLFLRKVPRYNQGLVPPGIRDYVKAASLHIRMFLSKRRPLSKMFPLLRNLGHGVRSQHLTQ
jgi:coenzyme F420 hydrogenase subunit beta